MRPYVARVLERPSNWMTYSTALFLRSLLEYEAFRCVLFLLPRRVANNNWHAFLLFSLLLTIRTRDRALLQMQALLDQHTTKLTPMQFSSKVVEDSAPAQVSMFLVPALQDTASWVTVPSLA